MNVIDSTPEFVASAYQKMEHNLQTVRSRLNRPLTLAEKLLLGHLDDPAEAELLPGDSYIMLNPDRVAHQDVTGQMAILQFMQSGRAQTARPDYGPLRPPDPGPGGSVSGLAGRAQRKQRGLPLPGISLSEIRHRFLEAGQRHHPSSSAGKLRLFPGGSSLGPIPTHPTPAVWECWPSAWAAADAADVMAGLPWEVKYPTLIGVHLTGELRGWTAPKDVIIYLAGVLTVAGGTNAIIEYLGPGTQSISCTGKATATNMGAELGATGDVFPYDERMATYLKATRREGLAELASRHRHLLTADPEVEKDPAQFFDRVIEIDLSKLEPQITGPRFPRPGPAHIRSGKRGQGEQFSGPCGRGLSRQLHQLILRGHEPMCGRGLSGCSPRYWHVPLSFLVTPGSEQVRATIARDGQQEVLEQVGATVLANACGPCIGQWRREGADKGEPNSIISSYNRNFPRRNDGNAETMNFIASPELALAMGLAGRLSFNPLTDSLVGADGQRVQPGAAQTGS